MRLTIYGDFNCPFSALASARADLLLEAAHHEVDWLAIQHDTAIPTIGEPTNGAVAVELNREVAEVLELSNYDLRLHLLVPPVRANTQKRARPSRRAPTSHIRFGDGSSLPCGRRATTSAIPGSWIVSPVTPGTMRSPASGRTSTEPSPGRSPPPWCFRMAASLGAWARSRSSPRWHA